MTIGRMLRLGLRFLSPVGTTPAANGGQPATDRRDGIRSTNGNYDGQVSHLQRSARAPGYGYALPK
jgi:hypothetical protein